MTSTTNRLKIVAAESVAQRWLMPRLPAFGVAHPGLTVEVETARHGSGAAPTEFDLWIAYAHDAAVPDAVRLTAETLYEDRLVPVCSPTLVETRGTPSSAADLLGWPLLYGLGGDADWASWFASQGCGCGPDLSRAWGFGLYSMVVRAAVAGMGAAVGHAELVAPEMCAGDLVAVLDRGTDAPTRCCLFTAPRSRPRGAVRAFRRWMVSRPAT